MKSQKDIELMLTIEENRLQYAKNQGANEQGQIENMLVVNELESRISILKWVLGMADSK
jgi:hypothetical protein